MLNLDNFVIKIKKSWKKNGFTIDDANKFLVGFLKFYCQQLQEKNEDLKIMKRK
jgi:hypothetical protein